MSKHYTISEFNPSTIYNVGDRFVYNGETYEVGNNRVRSDVSPKDEIGCSKVPVTKENSLIESAITLFKKTYDECKDQQHIYKPVSYALYQTWKEIDAKERKRNLKTEAKEEEDGKI